MLCERSGGARGSSRHPLEKPSLGGLSSRLRGHRPAGAGCALQGGPSCRSLWGPLPATPFELPSRIWGTVFQSRKIPKSQAAALPDLSFRSQQWRA